MRNGIAMTMTIRMAMKNGHDFQKAFHGFYLLPGRQIAVGLAGRMNVASSVLHSASVSLRILQQFGRGNGSSLFFAAGTAFGVGEGGRVQFLLRFLLASQVEQHLPAHVVGVGAFGIEL